MILKRHLIVQNCFVGANTDIQYTRICENAIIVIKTNPWKMILTN